MRLSDKDIESRLAYLHGMDTDEGFFHYGTKRHSGRYPWGSGENPYQHDLNFRAHVQKLRDEGFTDVQIAKAMDLGTTTELRKQISLAKNRTWEYETREMTRLREKGMSLQAIGDRFGVAESTVRSHLDAARASRMGSARRNAELFKEEVEKQGYIDVTKGVERHLGISATKMRTAVKILQEQGYTLNEVRLEQQGTGHSTIVKVLAKPGTTKADCYNALKNAQIGVPFNLYSEDGGDTLRRIEPPRSLDSKRVFVRYAEDGGTEKDGLIELRRGVPELSLKDARYAQVRIAVDGTHYMKGMAVYSDKIPPGYDVVYNSNKHRGTPLKGDSNHTVFKPMKNDPDNPFGATILDDGPLGKLKKAQRHYIDADGKEQLSCLNIVNEEGNWGSWSRTLASQFLGKQPPGLAKRQLDLSYSIARSEFNEIMGLTNPTVKKMLLEEFARKCDSDAVDLAAAALPRQATRVLLPFPEIKDGEIYAPHLNNGETVALVRYPHAGTFEIPVLRVNNNVKSVRDIIGQAEDAVGVNHKAAQILSGADFDGDNVICIPIDNLNIRTMKQLEGLRDFDTKVYTLPDDAPWMTHRQHGNEMGSVSNLITDMTIKGAPPEELVRAVKHSMVVVDAEKHHLDYKASEEENGIFELKERYQGGGRRGASTLLSRSTAEVRVNDRKEKAFRNMTPGEKERYLKGEKIWDYSGKSYSKPKFLKRDMTPEERARWDNPHDEITDPNLRKLVIKKEHEDMTRAAAKEGRVSYSKKPSTLTSTKMYEADDAFDLVSGTRETTTRIERVYAEYANSMKALANEARAAARAEKDLPYSAANNKVYKAQVESLGRKLAIAEKNAPLERLAQQAAGLAVRLKKEANPYMDAEHLSKMQGQELEAARRRFGAKKLQIGVAKNPITDLEWQAINAGAISPTMLRAILRNADSKRIKELAMPRTVTGMSAGKLAKARSMLSRGYTQAEVASMLDVSVTTLMRAVNG